MLILQSLHGWGAGCPANPGRGIHLFRSIPELEKILRDNAKPRELSLIGDTNETVAVQGSADVAL